MTQNIALPQVIKHGHIELVISNGMTAEEALQGYKGAYPELAFAKLSEGRIEGDKVIYEVEKEESVGTKG